MIQTAAVAKRGKAPGELYLPRGVAIDESTERIYVAELYSRRVSIFSETGTFMDNLSHKDMIALHAIAIHRDNLYVTDTEAHAVFKFKLEANVRFAVKHRNPIFGTQRFNSPLGLSVSAKGDVFIADSDKDRMQILDDSLHIQRSITHETMIEPRDIKLNQMRCMCSVLSLPASSCSLTQERGYAP